MYFFFTGMEVEDKDLFIFEDEVISGKVKAHACCANVGVQKNFVLVFEAKFQNLMTRFGLSQAQVTLCMQSFCRFWIKC